MARTVAAATLLVSLAAPASAHSEDELSLWLDSYEQMRDYDVAELLPSEDWDAVLDSMRDRHPCSAVLDTACPVTAPRKHVDPVHRGMGSSVEVWRSLVEVYFGAEANHALAIVVCESGGNSNALNPSGAAGLFQIMPFWWDHYGGDRFDPETNVRVAKAIRDSQGWGAWSCNSKI